MRKLRQLFQFFLRRVSPLAIGRKLGLDEKTVRVRVKKMEDDGFIKYYQAVPSLALFNLASANRYHVEALNITTKHRVVEGTPARAAKHLCPVACNEVSVFMRAN